MDEYATVAEAAAALGVSDRRVRYMVAAGAFAGAVKRGRDWLIPRYWQSRQTFPLLFAAFPDLTANIEQQTVDGEWVTTRAKLHGTHLGEFMGIAPTGKALEVMHISLDPIAGATVVEHFGVTEWLRALIAFEMLNAPTPFISQPVRDQVGRPA